MIPAVKLGSRHRYDTVLRRYYEIMHKSTTPVSLTDIMRHDFHILQALPESELSTYATAVRNNDELVDALYEMFEHDVPYEVWC